MTTGHGDAIDRSVQQTNIWLGEGAEACGVEDRGIHHEGWDPGAAPHRYREAERFLRRAAGEALLNGTTEASYAIAGAASVLPADVSEGEIADVLALLPAPVHELLGPGMRLDPAQSRAVSRARAA